MAVLGKPESRLWGLFFLDRVLSRGAQKDSPILLNQTVSRGG